MLDTATEDFPEIQPEKSLQNLYETFMNYLSFLYIFLFHFDRLGTVRAWS